MKALLLCVLLALSGAAIGQARTVKQLYDEYRKNKSVFETTYRNQTLTVTGKIRSISVASAFWKEGDMHRVHLTATGYENFVVCQIRYNDSALLAPLQAGSFVTVTGVVTSASDALYLTQCRFTPAQPTAVTATAPANAPLGKYEVYQNDGKGFTYQYSFFLKSYTSYVVNNVSGNCSYNPKTKVIRFTTGPLKGFAGLYRPHSDNEKDPPSFLLNPSGTIPDATGSHSGYQFGYWKKG